jgi:hypothetical protein
MVKRWYPISQPLGRVLVSPLFPLLFFGGGVRVFHLLFRRVERFPLVRCEENLLIVLAGVGLWLDVNHAELSGIGPAAQIGHRH